MSKNDYRLSYTDALVIANTIDQWLRPSCQRLELAGSLRRKSDDIGDIEFIAIPLFAPSFFTEIPGPNLLLGKLEELVQGEHLRRSNNGQRRPKFEINTGDFYFPLEIVISDMERWPIELAILTGPKEFSHKLVTNKAQGGFLPDGCRIKNGWGVYKKGERLAISTERQFIEFCCGKWIEPENRH